MISLAVVVFGDWSLRKQAWPETFLVSPFPQARRQRGLTLQKLGSQSPSEYSSRQEGTGLPPTCLWGVTLTRAALTAEKPQLNGKCVLLPWRRAAGRRRTPPNAGSKASLEDKIPIILVLLCLFGEGWRKEGRTEQLSRGAKGEKWEDLLCGSRGLRSRVTSA